MHAFLKKWLFGTRIIPSPFLVETWPAKLHHVFYGYLQVSRCGTLMTDWPILMFYNRKPSIRKEQTTTQKHGQLDKHLSVYKHTILFCPCVQSVMRLFSQWHSTCRSLDLLLLLWELEITHAQWERAPTSKSSSTYTPPTPLTFSTPEDCWKSRISSRIFSNSSCLVPFRTLSARCSWLAAMKSGK